MPTGLATQELVKREVDADERVPVRVVIQTSFDLEVLPVEMLTKEAGPSLPQRIVLTIKDQIGDWILSHLVADGIDEWVCQEVVTAPPQHRFEAVG